jgi:hypothetical protein
VESEKVTEAYLRSEIKKLGGTAYKFVSPGNAGVPDRMICLPGGRILFAELKSEDKKSTPKQRQQQDKLRVLGFTVYSDIDTKAKVDDLVRKLKNEI